MEARGNLPSIMSLWMVFMSVLLCLINAVMCQQFGPAFVSNKLSRIIMLKYQGA